MEEDISTIYKTQWKAHYKRGLGGPETVYGESEDEAKRNALALFRKNNDSLWNWPINSIVDKVELIG